jgi:hypothetical protein
MTKRSVKITVPFLLRVGLVAEEALDRSPDDY